MVDQLPPSNAPEAMLPWIKAIEAGQRKAATSARQLASQHQATLGFSSAAADRATLVGNQITNDRRAPALMGGLTASATAYYDTDGISRAYIQLSWPAVVTADDGSDLSDVSYEVWFRNTQEPVEAMRRSTTTAELTSRINNLESNLTYYVRVRAVSNKGIAGQFSNTVAVLTPSAGQVPGTPSTPTLSTSIGSVTLTWDGLLGGAPMPNWVASVQPMVATTSGGTYTAVGTPLTKAGSVVLADLPTNTTRYFKLRAVSKAGVFSTLSGTASIVVSGVDYGSLDDDITDAINAPLTDAKLAVSSLTIWPFVNQTIPANAFDPGAVGANDIADFSIIARKFGDNRHHIY